jgi:NNP family nitrate/nitrite transporter-like MFS transporter
VVVVGAAGGLGGFFPPLVMAMVKSETGSYALGFILMAAVAALALIVLLVTGRPARPTRLSADERPVGARVASSSG